MASGGSTSVPFDPRPARVNAAPSTSQGRAGGRSATVGRQPKRLYCCQPVPIVTGVPKMSDVALPVPGYR